MTGGEAILLVAADRPTARARTALLEGLGHAVSRAASPGAAQRLAAKEAFALVVLEEPLQAFAHRPSLPPVLVMTTAETLADAASLVRDGAFDYCLEPADDATFVAAVERALRAAEMTGEDPLAHAAASRAPVLIESGADSAALSLARSVHEGGPRSAGPFVALDCAAVAPMRRAVALLGHHSREVSAPGYTAGALRQADGGTLFLDNVASLHETLQQHLVRYLETGMIRPVGAGAAESVDVRLIARARGPARSSDEAEALLPALNARLNAIALNAPPAADLEGESAPPVGEAVPAPDPAPAANHGVPRDALKALDGLTLAEVERAVIENALATHRGNITRAARALAINPSTIYRKLETWGSKPAGR